MTWGVVRHKHATSALRHAHTFHQHPSHQNTLNSNAIAANWPVRHKVNMGPCMHALLDGSGRRQPYPRPVEANFAARQSASRHIAWQTGLAMALTARRRWVGRDKAGQAHALVAQPEADHHRGSQPPFASISVSCGRQRRRRARGPAMTLAAAPGAVSAQPASAPQWRVTLGNLAAGATAGVAVEAGRRTVLDTVSDAGRHAVLQR